MIITVDSRPSHDLLVYATKITARLKMRSSGCVSTLGVRSTGSIVSPGNMGAIVV